MSKFVIECPSCGRYAQARKGFFARKKIDCSCGHVINVRTEKLTSRECPHCGNNVVFDQSKGAAAKCPVCHEPINTMAEQSNTVEFSCAQCGIRLRTSKGAATYTCPVCDCVNDVAERVETEKIKHDGLASIIKYEGDNSTFIWKHPIEDFNYGSQLIVHESQEAIFFKDGQALDLFGPGRYTLETQQLPLLEKLYKLPTDTEGTFHSEVYFINKTVQMAVKWGTPEKVRFIDPLTGTPLELGASGEMNLMVSDSRKLLLRLVGTMKGIAWDPESHSKTITCEKCGKELYTANAINRIIKCDNKDCGHLNRIRVSSGFTKSLQSAFRPLITSAVKTNLPAVIKQNEIDLLEIDEKLDMISESLCNTIRPGFEEYGLTIPQFYVTHVVLPEDDPNFKRIRGLHTVVLQSKEYQAQAEIEAVHRGALLEKQTTETEIAKRKAERTVIEAQAEAQAAAQKTRLQGLAEAEVMAAKGYTQKDVLQADVQKAYAEGIGNMGPAVSGGGGSSVVSDMLGLGIGMAAAQTVAPQIGNMFSGMKPQGTIFPDQNTVAGDSLNAPKGWDCPACGAKNIQSKYCPDCGGKKPEPKADGGWDCPNCGCKNIISKFCPDCGTKKPEENAGWICPECGTKDITSKFCPNCGRKKPEEGWTCPQCGKKNVMSKFCPRCGRKKDA